MYDREKKVDGLIGVLTGVLSLEQALTSTQMEMFSENTPDGEALWVALQARRKSDDTRESYGWAEFAIEVITKNVGRYLTPHSCQLPEMFKECMGVDAHKKMSAAGHQMTEMEALSAHREEQPALDKLRAYLCRGCNVSECPLYLPRDSRNLRR